MSSGSSFAGCVVNPPTSIIWGMIGFGESIITSLVRIQSFDLSINSSTESNAPYCWYCFTISSGTFTICSSSFAILETQILEILPEKLIFSDWKENFPGTIDGSHGTLIVQECGKSV